MKEQGKISYFAAILMSINIMVGAGILYAVGPMTESTGSISFQIWPIIGLMLFPIIWSIAKAAQLFPGEGGFYHYCSSGINPMAGFIAHWGYLLGYMGTAASLATVLRIGIADHAGLDLIKNYPIIFNVILVTFYTLLNMISLNKISKLQSIGTLLKITPIIMVIAVMAFFYNPSLVFDISDLSQIGSTVSTVMFAYWGFEACCSIGGLLKDGPKKVGSVILVGFFVTMLLYFTFHLGLLYIMGPDNLAKYGAVAFPKFLGLSPMLGAALQAGILGAILFSWANSIISVSLGNITNINFLARKKMILGDKLLTMVNKNDRPVYAALAHGLALFAFITFITDVDILFALTNFGVLTAFTLTLTAVFITYLKQKNYTQLFITLLAYASCAALIYYSWTKIPSYVYVMPLVVGMIAGIAMYKVQQIRETKAKAMPVNLEEALSVQQN